jgi:biotin synthase-related radical SAM superfamily protein
LATSYRVKRIFYQVIAHSRNSSRMRKLTQNTRILIRVTIYMLVTETQSRVDNIEQGQ